MKAVVASIGVGIVVALTPAGLVYLCLVYGAEVVFAPLLLLFVAFIILVPILAAVRFYVWLTSEEE